MYEASPEGAPGGVEIDPRSASKVPSYLAKRQEELKAERDAVAEEKISFTTMTDKEREELLEGLKKNYNKLQKGFQTMSFTIDSAAKAHRKQWLEDQLDQYEKDIDMLERHQVIMISKS
eukprot:Clim_evm45s22 gene=Clim_evmTU45s22